MSAKNIYNVPTDLRNQLTNNEKNDFNYKFLGGIQNKDIKYSEIFNPSQLNMPIGRFPERVSGSVYTTTPLSIVKVTNTITGIVKYYICNTANTAGATFAGDIANWTEQVCDNDVVVATINTTAIGNTNDAELNDTDIKNIKTYTEKTMIQNPVPGIVTGTVGSEINTTVSIAKRFFDVLWNDMIKQTYHRVKAIKRFNI